MSGENPPVKSRCGLDANRAEVICHAWSTHGQHLAAYCSDRKIYVWNSVNCEQEKIFDTPPNITGISWSPEDDQIAAVSQDGYIFIWKIAWTIDSVTLRAQINTDAKRIISVYWTPDSQCLNIASVGKNIDGEYLALQRWDIKTKELLSSKIDRVWDKAYPAVSSQQRFLGLALQEGLVQVWDIQTIKLIGTFDRDYAKLYSLAYSLDGKTVALGWDNGWIDVWSLENESTKKITTLSELNKLAVFSLSFSKSGNLLASRSFDEHILLWNCADWSVVADLPSSCSQSNQVELAFQPFGSRIVMPKSQDQILEIWDVDEDVLLNNQMGYRITIDGNGNIVMIGNQNSVENTSTVIKSDGFQSSPESASPSRPAF